MDIQFLGAAGEVTGSCYLIRANGRQVLLECGLFQGSFEDEKRNREPFPFDPRAIDAVVLSHAHIDHSGRLPLLVKQGYRGPVYTHAATRDLCRIMLRDAGYLNEKEAEWENRKRQRKGLAPVEPLYTRATAEQALRRFKTLEYGERRDIAPGVTIRLNDAGHIIGSSVVEVWLSENGRAHKLVLSGDLGHRGAPILRDPTPVREADRVLLESTYGDRLHRPWEETWKEIGAILNHSDNATGMILIPSFAVGRSQELLYAFGEHFDAWGLGRWNIFLDSPMAIEATEVYARHWRTYDKEAAARHRQGGNPFVLPNLHFSKTANQSMKINRLRSGAIVIAGSGMCEGGRIKHHLKHHAWREDCRILIVGFQAAGTLGRSLVDGARKIRLWGETIRVAASVHTVGGLSAHADQDGLVDWYRRFDGNPPVTVVHGESGAGAALAERLHRETGAETMRPRPGERLDLV